jgi:hypothetical protein
MQQGLDAHQQSESLQQQISAERQHLETIEQRLDQISSSSQAPLESGVKSTAAATTTSRLMPTDIYHGGFFVETPDKSYSLIVNGLFQARYTGFKPANSVQALGESSQGTNNFDGTMRNSCMPLRYCATALLMVIAIGCKPKNQQMLVAHVEGGVFLPLGNLTVQR